MVRNSNYRRSHEWRKALKKQRLSQQLYGADIYPHLHQYSKNKVVPKRDILGNDWENYQRTNEPKASNQRRLDKMSVEDE